MRNIFLGFLEILFYLFVCLRESWEAGAEGEEQTDILSTEPNMDLKPMNLRS